MSPILQAIVFDYDGVLADTEPLHLRAFQETLRTRNVELTREDYFEHYLGLDDEGVFCAVARDRGVAWPDEVVRALVADKARRFGKLSATEPVLMPGVAARLRVWNGRVAMAIASGSLRGEIEPVLQAHGIRSLLPVIVAAGETPRGKPAADPYLRALELLAARRGPGLDALDPRRSVAIEDSPWGISAARQAGMKIVALATSYAAGRLVGADAVAARFDDLTLGLLEDIVCRDQPGRR